MGREIILVAQESELQPFQSSVVQLRGAGQVMAPVQLTRVFYGCPQYTEADLSGLTIPAGFLVNKIRVSR